MTAVLAVGFAMVAVGAPSAVAATPATPYSTAFIEAPDAQTGGSFGQRMKDAGDLDGDGVGDVWISAYSLDVGGMNDVGRVYAVSGRTRALLYRIDNPEPQSSTTDFAGFGWAITNLGDVDRDGVDDVVVGSLRHDATATGAPCLDAEPGCNPEQGKVWAFSGAPGKPKTPLYELNNPVPQAFGGFGGTGSAGDVVKADGTPGKDGIAEVLVGAFNNDFPTAGCGNQSPVPSGCRKDQGQTFLFNGALNLPAGTRRLVRTFDVPAEDRYVDPATNTCVSPPPPVAPPGARPIVTPPFQRCGALGEVNESTGDINADGFDDQSVTAWTTGISTATGLACGPEDEPDCLHRQGRIYIFNGRDGSLLRKIDDPIPQAGALFGLQKQEGGSPGDVNGDGFDDVYGNGYMQRGPSRGGAAPLTWEGRAWVFSGKDVSAGPLSVPFKTPLLTLLDPTPEALGSFGFSLEKTDYDRDGRPDLYIGSFAGSYVFRGQDGALQKIFDLSPADQATQPPGNTSLGFSIAAPGDLNGDCEPDYVAGSLQYDVTFENQGRTYFYLSSGPVNCPRPSRSSSPNPPGVAAFADCPSLSANVIRGSAAGGRITGTVRGDRIFAGTGNDVVDGLAGDDCIDLGPGIDRGQGGLGNDLLVGGLGEDRMVGNAGNDRLRGGSSADRLNGGFGNDRLHGQSGKDRLNGSRGRDRINGGSSNDVISAGSSNDRVAGDQGGDRINGNSGNDVLKGNSGNDRIKGSTGRDRISAGGGRDRIDARDGRGGDRISCGIGRDSVAADRGDRVARDCERVRRRG